MADEVGNVLHVPGYSGPGVATTDEECLASYDGLTQKGVTFIKTTEDAGIDPPVLATVTAADGGTLNGHYTYSVTALDADHRETLVSNIEEFDSDTETTTVVPPTLAGTPADTGGNLLTDTYYYVATSLTAAGETAVSNEVTAVIGADTGSVDLSWTMIPGATGYKVYRSDTTGVYTDTLLITLTSSDDSYLDDGVETPGTGTPPDTSTAGDGLTGDRTAVLTWAAVTDASGYRVYRDSPLIPGSQFRIGEPLTTGFSDPGFGDGDDPPPTRDTTAVHNVWEVGAVVGATSSPTGKYRAIGENDVSGPIGINRNQVDVSEEDKLGDVVFAGRIKGSMISYVDVPRPLTLEQLRTLAGTLGGRYEVVHDMLIF